MMFLLLKANILFSQMDNQRKNSGAEQEQLRQQLQKSQEAIKTLSKEMKDIKSKLSQVSCDKVSGGGS